MADFSIWSGPSETVPTLMDGRGRRPGAGRWPGVLTPSRCPFSKCAAVTPAHRWRAQAHTHPSSTLVPHLLTPKGPWAWKEEPVRAVSLSVAFEVNELVHHGSARSIDGCPASCPGQQGRASMAGHGGEQGCQRGRPRGSTGRSGSALCRGQAGPSVSLSSFSPRSTPKPGSMPTSTRRGSSGCDRVWPSCLHPWVAWGRPSLRPLCAPAAVPTATAGRLRHLAAQHRCV